MANKKVQPGVSHYFFPILFCLLVGCSSDKQIVVSESLNTGSERWKAKIRGGSLVMGRTSFGPFNTISYSKLDSPKLKSGTGSHFILLFRNTMTSKKRKVYTLTVSDNTDTASVMLFLWIKTESSEPGFFSLERNTYENNTKDAEGEITVNNEKVSCVFSIRSFDANFLNSSDLYQKTSGFFVYNEDTITISHVSEFTNGKPGLGHVVSKGITLNNKGEQVAALQLVENNYVWIRKDLPGKTRLAIAAFFSVILGSKDL